MMETKGLRNPKSQSKTKPRFNQKTTKGKKKGEFRTGDPSKLIPFEIKEPDNNTSALYLGDETVQVSVSGTLDVEGAAADIIDGFVVEHDGHIRVLQKGMRGQDAVVRLHHRSRDLWAWVHSESQLRLLSVVHGEALQKKRTQT